MSLPNKREIFEELGGLRGHSGRGNYFSLFIMGLIIINCVAIALETLPDLHQRFFTLFLWFDTFSVTIFTIEYIARIWSCTESERFAHPFYGRLKFALTPMALVDLLAILPFYLSFLVSDLRFLRVLRLLRLFRLIKLVRYSRAIRVFGRIISAKKEELVVVLILALMTIFISSSLIYMAEHTAQPDKFPSIPGAIWWSVITLTTVGYGDAVPVTDMGRLLGGFIAISGVGLIALPAGIFGSAMVLEGVFGHSGRITMRDHYIICGLGKIGLRVLNQLTRLGKDVVVIEKNRDSTYIEVVRERGIAVIIGDARLENILEEANVKNAKCLIAMSDNDLSNLEAAMNAKNARNDIHIVMRVLDHGFAQKIRKTMGIESAFSPSALSAPAFAMAAIDPCVIGSFYVGEELMLNIEIIVNKKSRLDGMTSMQLEEEVELSILVHESKESGEKRLHVSDEIGLKAGDKLVLSTGSAMLGTIHDLNRP